MFSFKSSKNPKAQVEKEAEKSLADLYLERQDMDLQIINCTHNRNAVNEKIAYFEAQLKESEPKAEVKSTEAKSEVKRPQVATVA